MSRLAREHPEDDRYQSLEGQREVLTDLADRDPQVTPCPYCGSPLDTPHRASCKLRADGEG